MSPETGNLVKKNIYIAQCLIKLVGLKCILCKTCFRLIGKVKVTGNQVAYSILFFSSGKSFNKNKTKQSFFKPINAATCGFYPFCLRAQHSQSMNVTAPYRTSLPPISAAWCVLPRHTCGSVSFKYLLPCSLQ